jgi:hypothetical protein
MNFKHADRAKKGDLGRVGTPNAPPKQASGSPQSVIRREKLSRQSTIALLRAIQGADEQLLTPL